jgi:serine/threonine protein phosphatase PrpC
VPASLLSQPTLAFAPETAHTAAFLEANKLLRAARVDDSLSGTTAITCLVRGTTLCVSNVGDSRACLAEDTGRALAAINLSCDQTPFRRETR